MRLTALRVVFVLLQSVIVTLPVDAAGTKRTSLVVRTYDAFHIAAADWDAAIGGAAKILNTAGIGIEWVHCSSYRAGEPGSGPARCTLPYARNEVTMRMIDRPVHAPADVILLGDSMLDQSMRSGTLATIYLDPVERLARAAGVTTGTVLARAMAHELGHLLLGTNTHSARGLMRPVWTAEELTRNEPVDWSIPRDEGEEMRRALARRESGNG
jgi:hypothetical protein